MKATFPNNSEEGPLTWDARTNSTPSKEELAYLHRFTTTPPILHQVPSKYSRQLAIEHCSRTKQVHIVPLQKEFCLFKENKATLHSLE